jgi:TolA-binding protein
MTLKLDLFRSKKAVLTAIGLALIAGTTLAQTATPEPIQWDKRRLEQLERNVRRIDRALNQASAAGEPVILQTDPEVLALQGRVSTLDRRLDDVEATLQRVNGDVERLTFQLDESTRDNAALRARLTDTDRRLKTFEDAARAEAELNAPITAHSPTGDAAQDLALTVRMVTAEPARGARALETVVVTWPDTPQAREANLALGDMRATANDLAGAVQAYAAALSGWPRTPWAAEATIKLATALEASDRDTQACGALGEFTRRYAEGATPALRTRATQVKTRAGCN